MCFDVFIILYNNIYLQLTGTRIGLYVNIFKDSECDKTQNIYYKFWQQHGIGFSIKNVETLYDCA